MCSIPPQHTAGRGCTVNTQPFQAHVEEEERFVEVSSVHLLTFIVVGFILCKPVKART